MQQDEPLDEEPYTQALQDGPIQTKPCTLEDQAIGHNTGFQLRLSPSWKAVCHGLISCNSQNTSHYGNMIPCSFSKPDLTLPWAGKPEGTQDDLTHSHLNLNSLS